MPTPRSVTGDTRGWTSPWFPSAHQRASAGVFSYGMIAKLDAHKARWSITIPNNAKVKAAVAGIDEAAWAPIAYPDGEAQVAECTITTGRRDPQGPRKLRLVVRRTRLAEGPQRELWPNWRHHCFVTNRHDLHTADADAHHRAHARVELAIRDLKDNGLAHCPSGKFSANGAHLACAALAHNLARWTARLGHAQNPDRLTAAATLRRRLAWHHAGPAPATAASRAPTTSCKSCGAPPTASPTPPTSKPAASS